MTKYAVSIIRTTSEFTTVVIDAADEEAAEAAAIAKLWEDDEPYSWEWADTEFHPSPFEDTKEIAAADVG